jgi:uncharacterized protein (TIGR02996 family)
MTRARGAELLAAVYADPIADAPRLVYADWLLERSDPRGELIALQCRLQRLDDAGHARIKELLAVHQAEWLAPLAPLVLAESTIFKRGFLAVCELDPSKRRADLGSLATNPSWSTVEMLFGTSASTMATLLAKAPLRALHHVTHDPGELQWVPPLRLERLTYATVHHRFPSSSVHWTRHDSGAWAVSTFFSGRDDDSGAVVGALVELLRRARAGRVLVGALELGTRVAIPESFLVPLRAAADEAGATLKARVSARD